MIINFFQDASEKVNAIDVQFISGIHKIEPVICKFEILSKIYGYRKQFSISLAYEITIHKN